MITSEEKDMIRARVSDYASREEAYLDMSAWDCDYILRPWSESKSHYLSKMFGDSLILKRPISYEKDVDELISDFEDAVEIPECLNQLQAMISFGQSTRTIRLREGNEFFNFLKRTLSPEAFNTTRDSIVHLLTTDSIVRNIYNGNTIEIPLITGKSYKIHKGCRVIKALGKLVELFGLNKEEYETFRIAHSQALNQRRLTGTLCISIHPLDYITMSDNDCGWDSCMSWESPGSYRQGTVEMMNSPSVVIAYLESSTPMRLCRDGYWSNKKWRELYVVTPEIISNVKGYPYCNSFLSKEVLKWLRELATENCGFNYYDDIYHWESHGYLKPFDDDLYNTHKVTLKFNTDHMYCDFGHSNQFCYLGTEVPDGETISINYSGVSECMYCGETNPYFYSDSDIASGALLCNSCEDTEDKCDECGCWVGDNYYVGLDGERLCESCFDDRYTTDMVLGDTIYRSDAIRVYIAKDHEHFIDDRDISIEIDERTADSLITTDKIYHKYHQRGIWCGDEIYYILENTWTENFLEALFNYSGTCYNEDRFAKFMVDPSWTEFKTDDRT